MQIPSDKCTVIFVWKTIKAKSTSNKNKCSSFTCFCKEKPAIGILIIWPHPLPILNEAERIKGILEKKVGRKKGIKKTEVLVEKPEKNQHLKNKHLFSRKQQGSKKGLKKTVFLLPDFLQFRVHFIVMIWTLTLFPVSFYSLHWIHCLLKLCF